MKKFVFLPIFATLFLGSCTLPQYQKESPEINEIPPHTKFRINLPEDHREKGFWHLKQDYDQAVVRQINEVWHGNEKGVDFNLKSQAAGQTTLNFVFRDYKDTLDFKHFIVKISPK